MFQTKLLSDDSSFWAKAEDLLKKRLSRFSPAELAFFESELKIPFEPNDMNLGIVYDVQNSEFESFTSQMHSTHYFEPSPNRLIKHIFEHVTLKPGQTFLDIGGGVGQVNLIAGLLQPLLARNICFDLNQNLLNTGKSFVEQKAYPYPIEFQKGDIFKNVNLLAAADLSYHYVAFDKTGIRKLLQEWLDISKTKAVMILEEVAYRMDDLHKMTGLEYVVLNNANRHIYNHFATFILTKK